MINISKQIYVGWNSYTGELPEANMIPLGDSIQEKKKLEKFVQEHITLTEYDNIPLPGFTLYTVGKKSWNSADSTWLVIDPRGFLVRITQSNMANILHVTGITEGLIQQRCVWSRDNNCSTMVLIPTSSPDYIEAVGNTELLESRVDMCDVAIGDTVLLRNKLKGTYWGVQSLYCSMDNLTARSEFKVQTMLRRQIIEITPGKFHYQTDAKILKVLTKAATTTTREDAALYLNNTIKNNVAAYFTPHNRMNSHYYGSNGKVKLVSTHAVSKVSINLVEIDLDEATSVLTECITNSDVGYLVVENIAGKQFTVDFPWWGGSIVVTQDEFYVNEIAEVKSDHIIHVPKTNQYYGSFSSQKPRCTLDSFTKFYKIVKSVKSDTYV